MEIAILILLIGNLALGGWIMATLNEIDRTNISLTNMTQTNQAKLLEAIKQLKETN